MDELELATVELLGALAYGQLRSFETTARAVRHTPDARAADQLASFSIAEHDRYRRLLDALRERTELPAAVIDRHRRWFDDYFDRAPMDDWFGVCVFFALGLPMASDFARAIAPTVDERAATVLLATLERREEEGAAIRQLAALLVEDADRERARLLSADLLGRALTSFQNVMAETDALRVLLAADRAPGESSEQRVRRLALSVLDGHRRRVIELGLEDLDDVS